MQSGVKKPLVTISIPTRNSEKFIGLCLDALKKQTYGNFEVNLVDAGSTDKTIAIAKNHSLRPAVHTYRLGLLGARKYGLDKSKGDLILLLDSDQILDPKCLEMCVNELVDKDMLVLGEDVYKSENWIEKLFHYDRVLIHKVKDLNPLTSVLLPRFYKTGLLKKAMSNISKDSLEKVSGQDHAIIYHEVWKLSQKVGVVNNMVLHIEPDKLSVIWSKFYRWGYTSFAARHNEYSKILYQKERFRKGLFTQGLYLESIASIILLILKGIPYKCGSTAAYFKSIRGKNV